MGYTDKVASTCERVKKCGSTAVYTIASTCSPGDAVHVQLYTYVAGGYQTDHDAVGVIPKRFIHTCSLCTVYMGTTKQGSCQLQVVCCRV